jgi:hypothetical protein
MRDQDDINISSEGGDAVGSLYQFVWQQNLSLVVFGSNCLT